MQTAFTLAAYADNGVMTEVQAQFISEAIKQKKNIIICGAAGAGATCLMNAMLFELSTTKERLYIIENSKELYCMSQNKVMPLLNEFYTCSKAISDAMRMNVDRIIIDEIRDAAALDILKAWSTGYGGGFAAIRAQNPDHAMGRLCCFVEEAIGRQDKRYASDLISGAIDICIHIEYKKGVRKLEIITPFSN